jgi:hypothetical protein
MIMKGPNMKYAMEDWNKQFTIMLAEEVEMTVKVNVINRQKLYNVYTGDRFYGTFYQIDGGWRTDDNMAREVLELIGGLIEPHIS